MILTWNHFSWMNPPPFRPRLRRRRRPFSIGNRSPCFLGHEKGSRPKVSDVSAEWEFKCLFFLPFLLRRIKIALEIFFTQLKVFHVLTPILKNAAEVLPIFLSAVVVVVLSECSHRTSSVLQRPPPRSLSCEKNQLCVCSLVLIRHQLKWVSV